MRDRGHVRDGAGHGHMFQAVRFVMGSIYGLVLAAWLAYALLVRCLRGYGRAVSAQRWTLI